MLLRLLALVGASIALTPTAGAQPRQAEGKRSQMLTRLVDCKQITNQQARLECYDREVAALDTAEKRKDLVIVDREQLRKTRRTLFGLTLPNLSVFGDDNEDQEGIAKIDTKIRTVGQTPLGKYTFTLADGAQWEQIDGRDLPITPRPGHNIKIRRAAMGSYLANIKDQTAIRVRRLR